MRRLWLSDTELVMAGAVVGLIGLALAAVGWRRASALSIPLGVGAVLVATAELPAWALLPVAVVGAAAWRLPPRWPWPAGLGLAAAGAFLAVPDTEALLPFLPAVLPVAAIAAVGARPWPVSGLAATTLLHVEIVLRGARGRPAAVVPCLVCLGIGLCLAATTTPSQPLVGRAVRWLLAGIAVLVVARTAGLAAEPGSAAALAAGVALLHLAADAVVRRSLRRLGQAV